MNYVTEKNNKVYVMGEIVSDATFSHEVYGEGFYEFFVRVMRLSGQADTLPITISERLIQDGMLAKGKMICALGQFRSYNKLENGRSRLMLTVFVRELLDVLPDQNPNSILLTVKSPTCWWQSIAHTINPITSRVLRGAETLDL